MNETEHLLSCLAEEASEVAQRVSKALRFGLQEVQPGQPYTNAFRIMGELTDLAAVVSLLEERGVFKELIGDATLEANFEAKRIKVRKFMDYARQCGTLT